MEHLRRNATRGKNYPSDLFRNRIKETKESQKDIDNRLDIFLRREKFSPYFSMRNTTVYLSRALL